MELKHVAGVEGPSIYLNDYRIAGPKPWGGGKVVNTWKVREEDVRTALAHLALSATKETTVQGKVTNG